MAAVLAACGSPSPLVETIRSFAAQGTAAPPADPALRYLRAVRGDSTAYLVLGYREPGPQGETEVYYSALGEVVKLRQGRLEASAGLPVDWRAVRRSGAPDWPLLLAQGPSAEVRYSRERDVMPGYRFGIRETVVVRPIASPQAPADLVQAAGSLRWFEESSLSAGSGAANLPPARFAVLATADPPRVVYSEQCLAPAFCLSLQMWPGETAVALDSAAARPAR